MWKRSRKGKEKEEGWGRREVGRGKRRSSNGEEEEEVWGKVRAEGKRRGREEDPMGGGEKEEGVGAFKVLDRSVSREKIKHTPQAFFFLSGMLFILDRVYGVGILGLFV